MLKRLNPHPGRRTRPQEPDAVSLVPLPVLRVSCGAGQLMIDSINARDFPVVQAVTLVFAVLVVLVYLLTDIVHALLDPRVRFD